VKKSFTLSDNPDAQKYIGVREYLQSFAYPGLARAFTTCPVILIGYL
jgi:hypothetical protein